MTHFKLDEYPSEFMLHSFFDDLINIDNTDYNSVRIHRTIWETDIVYYKKTTTELWEEFQKREDYLILSIHKLVLRKMTIDDFERVLNTLNFTVDDEVQEILNSNIKSQNVPAFK